MNVDEDRLLKSFILLSVPQKGFCGHGSLGNEIRSIDTKFPDYGWSRWTVSYMSLKDTANLTDSSINRLWFFGWVGERNPLKYQALLYRRLKCRERIHWFASYSIQSREKTLTEFSITTVWYLQWGK